MIVKMFRYLFLSGLSLCYGADSSVPKKFSFAVRLYQYMILKIFKQTYFIKITLNVLMEVKRRINSYIYKYSNNEKNW